MRKLFTILAAVLLTASVFLPEQASAQSPEKMSYQAVIRNSSDVLVTNTQIGMEINFRQGTVSGTVVYTETQTPTTNANGLASIEIGGETGFNAIDWSAGPYFIEIKTDPTGGTNYTIIGTSQLLSVPYALYAKTAETLSEGITETDPLFTAWDKDYNDLINKPTIDGSETKVTAGTNVTVTGIGTTANPYVINSTGGGSATRYVGELYGGGVVFWVDHTGQHGLILSMVDLSTSRAWSNISSTLVGTTNDWDGANNTIAIIGQSGHTSSAAQLGANYTNADYGTGTYSDWYLPSVAELNHIWNNFYEVQKALTNDGNPATRPLIKESYWSSSELTNIYAWSFGFSLGYALYSNKYNTYDVRAVRAF
jgi:hypothetical protein